VCVRARAPARARACALAGTRVPACLPGLTASRPAAADTHPLLALRARRRRAPAPQRALGVCCGTHAGATDPELARLVYITNSSICSYDLAAGPAAPSSHSLPDSKLPQVRCAGGFDLLLGGGGAARMRSVFASVAPTLCGAFAPRAGADTCPRDARLSCAKPCGHATKPWTKHTAHNHSLTHSHTHTHTHAGARVRCLHRHRQQPVCLCVTRDRQARRGALEPP
jgi:hypothetical protein